MVYRALEEDRIKVFYQPQFDPENCNLMSAEALCRIENEYHEIILPGEFIPVLEKQKNPDVIRRFDWCVFTKVCQFLCRLRSEGMRLIPISVNLSRRHLTSDPSEHYLSTTANIMKIPHNYLGVEITESAVTKDGKGTERVYHGAC